MNNTQVTLKAIKPINDFSYLTKIRDRANPYILNNKAILTALNFWKQKDITIKNAYSDIREQLEELHKINLKLKEISNVASTEKPEIKVSANPYLNNTLFHVNTTNFKAKTNTLKELSIYAEKLNKKRKSLISKTTAENGWTLDAILFKIMNEKAYYMSHLCAKVATNIVLESEVNIIHTHHFGNELMLIKKSLDENNYSSKYPTMIKSLHGLNVKLTHLNGRRNPIRIGIESADGIHVVSSGSFKELETDIKENHYFYPESKSIDLNKVFVAANGINHKKFSLIKNWKTAKEKFSSELKQFPNDIKHLDLYEQKQIFKRALAAIIPSLLEDKLLKFSSWCNQFNPNKTMMLFVGRLCKAKAYKRLETAAEAARNKGAQLAIMGFGNPLFELRIKTKYPEVIFLNNMPDQRLIGSFLRGAADICLLTSNRETAGIVLLEGQSMGQTVLTSSLPGPMSLSNPETFWQFNIITKENVTTRDHDFEFVDEEKTRENLYIQLEKTTDYFEKTPKENILQDIKSNIEFSKKFTANNMLSNLDILYTKSGFLLQNITLPKNNTTTIHNDQDIRSFAISYHQNYPNQEKSYNPPAYIFINNALILNKGTNIYHQDAYSTT